MSAVKERYEEYCIAVHPKSIEEQDKLFQKLCNGEVSITVEEMERIIKQSKPVYKVHLRRTHVIEYAVVTKWAVLPINHVANPEDAVKKGLEDGGDAQFQIMLFGDSGMDDGFYNLDVIAVETNRILWKIKKGKLVKVYELAENEKFLTLESTLNVDNSPIIGEHVDIDLGQLVRVNDKEVRVLLPNNGWVRLVSDSPIKIFHKPSEDVS